MSLVRCQNYIEVYRQKAKSKQINELSGRTGRPDLTLSVNQHILQTLGTAPHEVIVDIGCGDGTLLRLAAPHIRSGIGILPTPEEVTRLRQELGNSWANLNIQQGIATDTGLPANSADKIICNGVILLLESSQVDATLQEIVRLAKTGAPVWLGEIPEANEFIAKPYGDSIWRWLLWVLRHQGTRAFYQRCKQTLIGLCSAEPFIISPKTLFYETEPCFIRRAQNFGLEWHNSQRHQEIAPNGTLQSTGRMDYLFYVRK